MGNNGRCADCGVQLPQPRRGFGPMRCERCKRQRASAYQREYYRVRHPAGQRPKGRCEDCGVEIEQSPRGKRKLCVACGKARYGAYPRGLYHRTKRDKPQLLALEVKPRSCLQCGNEFESQGPWNRICPRCVPGNAACGRPKGGGTGLARFDVVARAMRF